MKSFSDGSGTVFFNTVSGETIALALSEHALTQLLVVEQVDPNWDSEFKQQLAKVMVPPAILVDKFLNDCT